MPSRAFLLCDIDDEVYTTWLHSIVGVIQRQGLAGLVPAKPSYGMTMTKIGDLVLRDAADLHIESEGAVCTASLLKSYHFSALSTLFTLLD